MCRETPDQYQEDVSGETKKIQKDRNNIFRSEKCNSFIYYRLSVLEEELQPIGIVVGFLLKEMPRRLLEHTPRFFHVILLNALWKWKPGAAHPKPAYTCNIRASKDLACQKNVYVRFSQLQEKPPQKYSPTERVRLP